MANSADIAVQLKAVGMEDLMRALKQVREETERTSTSAKGAQGHASHLAETFAGMGEKQAKGVRHVSFALNELARSGSLAGGGVKGIIEKVAELAIGFGPQGVLVGAVAGATLAIVSLFRKTREELEATKKKFDAEIGAMAGSGDAAGLMKKMQEMSRGQYNIYSRQREYGLDAMLTARNKIEEQFRGNPVGGEMKLREFDAVIVKLNNETWTVGALIEKYKLLNALILNPEAQRAAIARGTSIVAGGSTGAPTTAPGMSDFRREVLAAQAAMGGPGKREGTFGNRGAAGVSAGSIAQTALNETWTDDVAKQIGERAKKTWAELKVSGEGLVGAFSSGLASGFAQLAQGGSIGDFFSTLGKTFLSGLGGLLQQLGERLLLTNQLIAQAMDFTNPISGIAAAIALIALGGVLQGIGGRSSSQASVPVGAGPGAVGSNAGTVIDRGTIGGAVSVGSAGSSIQMAAGPTTNGTFNFFVVNPADPQTQRDIADVVKGARARNLL